MENVLNTQSPTKEVNDDLFLMGVKNENFSVPNNGTFSEEYVRSEFYPLRRQNEQYLALLP